LFLVSRLDNARRGVAKMTWRLSILISLLTSVLVAPGAQAAWPKRLFAPYMYVGSGDDFKLTHVADETGLKYYTLAFIIADKDANPAWDGRIPMDKNFYADQIVAIRQRGGDVIVSFGGEGGTELAITEKYPDRLLAKYQSIADRYKFQWLDFDIEGKALHNMQANARRNQAIAHLQAKSPDLIVSYTLPVDPRGLPQAAIQLLSDAKAQGVKIRCVNIMVMDFDPGDCKGRTMADVAIASAMKARAQTIEINPGIQMGLCPMLGQNDEKSEVFTIEDAQALGAFADKTDWVGWLSFWSINRDNGSKREISPTNTSSGIVQKPWAFTEVFKSFAAVPAR